MSLVWKNSELVSHSLAYTHILIAANLYFASFVAVANMPIQNIMLCTI